MEDTWALGKLLRTGREQAGLSKRAAAAAAGLSEGRWRQLESGYIQRGKKRSRIETIPTETLYRAAAALNLPLADVLRAAGHNNPQDMPVTLRDEIAALLYGMDAQQLLQVRGFITGLRAASRQVKPDPENYADRGIYR